MDQINSKPLHSTKTIKISSRTSVQSEPVLTSDGEPALKYKPVTLYTDEGYKHEEGVFSLDDDKTLAKGDTEAIRDKVVADEYTTDIQEDTERNEVQSVKGENKVGQQNDHEAAGNEVNKLVGEPRTELRWRGLSPVEGEPVTTEKGKGTECGFCEQDQVKPKLLPCFHSFCKECIEKLIFVRNSRHWMKCPLCKKRLNLTNRGVNAIEDNIYVQECIRLYDIDDNICGMCKEHDASYRCSDCQTDLCTDCVAKHLRNLTETEHSIKNLTRRASITQEMDSETRCGVHKEFSLELFCNTCAEPICGRCAINKHLNHVTEDIAINANDKRKHLKGVLSDSVTSRLLRDMRDNLASNRKEKARLGFEINKITGEIREHMDKLKTNIDKMGNKLIEELKLNEEAWLASLDRKYQEAEYRQRSAEQIFTISNRIIEKAKDVDFIRKYVQLKTAIQGTKKTSKPVLQCVSCQFIPLSKPGLFGRIKMNASLQKPVEFYDAGKATFQKRIYCICPTSESKAWIGYGKTLQLCNKDGKLGLKVDLDDMVISIAENSLETVFVACKTAIKVIGSKGVPKTCFHIPHEPSDMTFNDEDNLIICYKDARRVSVHSTKGKVIKELDVRHFGYRFGARITDPWRISISENQDLLVADYSSENIAVFDGLGEMKSTFRCNVFRRAILCCYQGLTFVADQRKDQIYVFSDTGHLLQTIRTEGISGLWSMNIDKDRNLWLGSLHGALKIYGRK